MDTLRFWCQKVLPLVYDDSLSYLEVLCKIKNKLNEIIDNANNTNETVQELKNAVAKINEWIDNFDTKYIKEIVDNYIATMIFIAISDAGYIVYYMPESWKDIEFNTTGLDIDVAGVDEYGHLILSY